MKRILFPLAVIVSIAAAAISGAHSTAHPMAVAFIDHVQSYVAFID